MGKKLHKCKSGSDFLRYAEKQERAGKCEIRRCKSSHAMVKVEGFGAQTIPVHADKQLGPGLLRALVKWFVLAGLGLFVLMTVGLLCGAWSWGM